VRAGKPIRCFRPTGPRHRLLCRAAPFGARPHSSYALFFRMMEFYSPDRGRSFFIQSAEPDDSTAAPPGNKERRPLLDPRANEENYPRSTRRDTKRSRPASEPTPLTGGELTQASLPRGTTSPPWSRIRGVADGGRYELGGFSAEKSKVVSRQESVGSRERRKGGGPGTHQLSVVSGRISVRWVAP
jgi:hypothetical protein